jgi:hypothetical protein
VQRLKLASAGFGVAVGGSGVGEGIGVGVGGSVGVGVGDGPGVGVQVGVGVNVGVAVGDGVADGVDACSVARLLICSCSAIDVCSQPAAKSSRKQSNRPSAWRRVMRSICYLVARRHRRTTDD